MSSLDSDGYAVNVNWNDKVNVNQYDVQNANPNWGPRAEVSPTKRSTCSFLGFRIRQRLNPPSCHLGYFHKFTSKLKIRSVCDNSEFVLGSYQLFCDLGFDAKFLQSRFLRNSVHKYGFDRER